MDPIDSRFHSARGTMRKEEREREKQKTRRKETRSTAGSNAAYRYTKMKKKEARACISRPWKMVEIW